MTWWLCVRDPVEVNFLFCVFSPLTFAEVCEKNSRFLWKESCVRTGVRKPGNTCASPTAILAVKLALNPNTTKEPSSNSEEDASPKSQPRGDGVVNAIRVSFGIGRGMRHQAAGTSFSLSGSDYITTPS